VAVQTPTNHEIGETQETRDRILEAAQKLFAERGFDATSVRDITAEAGCNVAAVNYHFGGKESLYLEAFRAMLGILRDRRLAVLDELLLRSPPPDLEAFLTGFAEGFLDPLTDESLGRRFFAFVNREISDPRLPTSVFLGEFIRPLLDRTLQALHRVGPPLPSAVAEACIFSLIGQLLHALKAHHLFLAHDEPEARARLADFVPHFVRFSAGGIRACALDERPPATPLTGVEPRS
jgi:AcrR family transcriptional regulator